MFDYFREWRIAISANLEIALDHFDRQFYDMIFVESNGLISLYARSDYSSLVKIFGFPISEVENRKIIYIQGVEIQDICRQINFEQKNIISITK